MKKIALLASIIGSLHAQCTIPNFELWNKHNEPVYYHLADSAVAAARGAFEELRPGKRTTQTLDLSRPRAIAIKIGSAPTRGDKIDVYTLRTNKTLYLRVGLPAEKEKFKETIKQFLSRNSIEANGYIFGPQVGPLLGFKGVTEQGYPLKNNISKNDIQKSTRLYESQ